MERLAGVRGDAAGHEPADVPQVAPCLRERAQPPLVEDRGHHHHVRHVRDGAVRPVGVVVPVQVAVLHRFGRVVLEDAVDQVGGHRQRGARHQVPLPVEEGGEVVLLLADEGRHGRALDHGLHLLAGGQQRALDQLQRHSVHGCVHRHLRSRWHGACACAPPRAARWALCATRGLERQAGPAAMPCATIAARQPTPQSHPAFPRHAERAGTGPHGAAGGRFMPWARG